MNLKVTVHAPESFRRLVADVGPLGRRQLHEQMGMEAQVLTIVHLQRLADTRHDTAEKLGAAPTGFLAEASEKVALAANNEDATLTIDHPGIGRAFHAVTISPKNAKSLAIPIHAIAYGHRARYLWTQLSLFIPKGCNFIAMKGADGKSILPLYILVRSVTQKQDRTLLPSDEEYENAATAGAKDYIRGILEKRGRA